MIKERCGDDVLNNSAGLDLFRTDLGLIFGLVLAGAGAHRYIIEVAEVPTSLPRNVAIFK
ncbi:hypothetical protein ACFS07_16350 [Undibacterium arcticum]